jgi:Ca2+-transporting ATPase
MTAASPTQTHVDSLSGRSRSHSRSHGKKDSADSDGGVTAISDGERQHSGNDQRSLDKGKGVDDDREDPKSKRVELEQDMEDANPAPYAFKPYDLASMLDPKNLEALEARGGVEELLKGLGTNRTRGLDRRALLEMENDSPEAGRGDDQPGAGLGASQRHERDEEMGTVPGIVVTAPDGEGDTKGGEGTGPAYTASIDERRRVYGHNVLPHRATKSLLALMWLALKDKVLVCKLSFDLSRVNTYVRYIQVLLSIAAVVSLALGFFQDFGTPRPAGEPPVDWVEGVAIMVAIFIVVGNQIFTPFNCSDVYFFRFHR